MSAPTELRLAYDSTPEDAAEASYRLAIRAGATRTQKSSNLFWGAIFFLVIPLILRIPWLYLAGPALAALWAALMWLYGDALAHRQIRKQARQLYRSNPDLGGAGPAEYIADESGIEFRKAGQSIRTQWSNVTAATEGEEYIHLATSPAGVFLIPLRAFRGEEELDAWRDWILEHVPGDTATRSDGDTRNEQGTPTSSGTP